MNDSPRQHETEAPPRHASGRRFAGASARVPGPMDWIIRVVKGVVISLGFILPGVSGGVLAAILGLYERLLRFLAHFRRRFRVDFPYFVPVGVGGVLGLGLLSSPLAYAIEHWRVPVMWAFAGAILGTVPALWRTAAERSDGRVGRDGTDWAWLVGTFAVAVVGLYLLPFATGTVPASFGGFLVAGGLIALGVLVPGLSPSNLLIILGLLQPMLQRFGREGEFGLTDALTTLVAVALGAIVVLGAFSKLMERVLDRFHSRVYHFIIGFVLASTVLILVPTPSGSVLYGTDDAMTYAGATTTTIVVAAVLFLAGLALGLWMAMLEKKYKTVEAEV